jgi:hypothetical protein
VAADKPDIDALEQAWRDALFAKDEKALRKLIHPKFQLVGIRSTGTLSVGLEQWIETLGKMDIANLEVRVCNSVVCKNTMIATVEAKWRLRFLRHLIDERVLLTDVWIKDGKEWQVIRRHSSPVPPGVVIE